MPLGRAQKEGRDGRGGSERSPAERGSGRGDGDMPGRQGTGTGTRTRREGKDLLA